MSRVNPPPIGRFWQCFLWLSLTGTLMIFTGFGCEQREGHKPIRLHSNLRALDTVDASSSDQRAFKVAIGPMLSLRESLKAYKPLLDQMSLYLNRPIQPIQRRTHGEVNALLQNHACDVAFVSPYPYILGRRDFGLELVAVPKIRGRTTYHSYIIVPTDSAAQQLSDLQQKVFAFSDPLSNSGWLYPCYLLVERNTSPEQFFRRYLFTYSHDNTLRAVADGLVDGGAVDSLVYDGILRRYPHYRGTTRIIHRSPEFPSPPVVINSRLLNSPIGEKIQRFFLTLHQTPEGERSLQFLDIDRFMPLTDEAYEPIRRMLRRIEVSR